MFSFESIYEALTGHEKRTVAVAAAQGREVLESVKIARDLGLADFILVGRAMKIKQILDQMGEKEGGWPIVDVPDEAASAVKVAEMVAGGQADVPMKGLLQTGDFLRAVLNRKWGLMEPEALLSQITVMEHKAENRFILITDCAINVAPDYGAKVKIAANAIVLARKLGLSRPKVAVIAAVEIVNPAMPETVEAAMLTVAAQRGQLGAGALVEGPLALDNAVSLEAARIKNLAGPVAGQADILLMPNLVTANVLEKSLRFFAGLKSCVAVMGARVPLIMTSRSDTVENRVHTIALSLLIHRAGPATGPESL